MRPSHLLLPTLLLLAAASCSSDDEAPPFPPSAAWPKFRQNVNNTGSAVAPIAQTTPAILWSVPVDAATPAPVSSSPAIAVDGRVYVGSEGGTLLAVNGKGQVHWRTDTCAVCPTPPLGPLVSSPFVYTTKDVNYIFIASLDGRLLGFEDKGTSANCTLCFSPAAIDPTVTSASMASSPTLTIHPLTGLVTGIFITTTVDGFDGRTGRVYAVNSDGTLQWQFPDPAAPNRSVGPMTASPALSLGNALYVVTDDGAVFALTLDGSLLWSGTVEAGRSDLPRRAAATDLAPSPVTTADLVLAASRSGAILAWTLGGSLAWTAASEGNLATSLSVGSQAVLTPTPEPTDLATPTPTPSGASTGTPTTTPTPGDAFSTAFGVTEGGSLVVRDLRTGERLFPSGPAPTPIVGAVRSSPAVSADQYLIFGTDAGHIYVIDTANGAPLEGWPVQLPGASPIRSSPSISEGGTIYVGATDGMLYAVGEQ
ncbi:PQQ-binding-like beta-propeller repeat protein [Candidatus Binatia bacterium]|nr:PQQ-binding-like beta-propeller repeat protein [Candidatus Binatia bacterium]